MAVAYITSKYQMVAGQNHVRPNETVNNYFFGGSTNPSNSNAAFATAILQNGIVTVSGSSNYGGDSSTVSTFISDGVELLAVVAEGGFVAVKNDGNLKSWGNWAAGNLSDTNVVQIATSMSGWAALKSDGTIISAGAYQTDKPSGSNFVKVFAGGYGCYAALTDQGSLVTWGYASGSNIPTDFAPSGDLGAGIIDVAFDYGAGIALKNDGSMVTWAHPGYRAELIAWDFGANHVPTGNDLSIIKSTTISLPNIIKTEGISVAGNINGKVTVSYTLNGNGADLGYSVIDLKDLSVVATNTISNPYGQIIGRDQGIRNSIDSGSQTMIVYNSQPSGYHANQNAIFVNSDGTHSSEYVLTNGGGGVADWLGVISRFSDGKYALVIQSERQGAMDIFAEMLDSTGTTRTVELFRVNNTTSGEQVAPNCYAVPNSHKLLVSWYNAQSGSASQLALIDMDKQLNVSGDQIISNAAPNTVTNQSILVDATGTHGQVLYIENGDIWSRAFDINGNALTMGATTNLTSSLHWQSGVGFVRASSVLGNDGQQYIALVGNSSTTEKVFVLKTQMTGQAQIASSLEVYSGLKNDSLTPRVDINLADGQLVVSWLTIDGIGIASIDSVSQSAAMSLKANSLPTGTVTIIGTLTQGQTLTASNTLADTDGLGAINYQWLSNGAVISGATGNNYVLAQTDVGKAISVQASYIDLLGTAESVLSNQTVAVSAQPNSLPTGSVTFTGNPIQGQTLVASNSLADADGLGTISYQWSRAGTAISGATQTTYTLTQADVGKTVLVTASYTDKLGAFESVRSLSTPSIANINDTPTGSVVIAGNSTQGQTLTASNTLADADGLGAISYQWLRAGTPIVGATQSSYILGQSDVGRAISVLANYVDLWGTSESVQSTQPSAIAPKANSLPIGNVNISGTPTQGQTLFASNNLSDADGLGTISYQWLRAGAVISGATQSNYTLTQADVGKNITVKASYTDLTGVAESVTSNATLSIANVNDLPIGVVSINGLAKTGQTLTASNTLTDADGLGSLSYQWLRSGSVISGANQSSYTLTSNDVNSTISVKASYTDGFGAQEAVTSSATAMSNNAPTGYATASLTNGAKNTSYTIYASTLLQGFSDADDDVLTVTNLSATNSSISSNGNNTWTLTPSTNYVGVISLNYSVTDSKSTPIAASQSLSVIQNQVPPTGTVSISGTTQQYQTLYANNALADTNGLGTINYQWLSNGNVISGANQNSYLLTQTEVGKTITVTASYIDGLGKLESMTSSATNSVTNVNDLPKGSVYINGKPNQAQVLTASNDISDLDGLGAINYQWLRSGSLINGANQSSYTLTANDVNSSISVKASYTDSYGTTESVTSSSITAQPPAQTPPTGSVIINGTSQQNQTLIASQNLADINGLGTINYEWLRNENIISGATQISYTLTQADVGKAITVRTSYTDGLGKLESVTSSPTSPVVNVNDLSTGSVTISGEAKQGRIFTASNNIADADGLGTISYQWLRNGEIISNANNSSYTLTQADANQSLSVKASYMDGQGTRESVNSPSLSIAPSNILSVSSPTINEGDTGQSSLTFTLTLSPAVQQSTSVDYTSQSGTATAGTDFTTASGTVQFNAGETSKTITVPVLGDTAIENDETFNLVLSNPRILEFSNASNTLTALGTIRNDDFPTLSLSGPQSVKEGNTGQTALNYTAKLSQAAPFDISVDYATQGITATAGQDFTSQSGTFKFAAGSTEKSISVPVLGDTADEPDETLSFVLSNPQNAKFANNVNELRSAGTILNDDSQTVRLNSPSVIEGDSGVTFLKFLVSLGYAVNSDVTIDYKIEDVTATLNTDYVVTTNTVTLSAGQQSTEINIPISGDTRIEPIETLKLTINSATGITLPINTLPISSIGTIINDDLPLISILAAKTTYEPAIGFKNVDIPVTLSATASTDIIISYHTEGGTATQDKDFLNSSAKLTIPANANTGIISVPINADSEKEPDETFKVIIDKVEGGAKLSTGQSSLMSEVTISAISLPVLAVQDVALQEGDSGNKNLTFKVNLSAASALPVTFSVKTTDKTATAGLDYLALNSVTKTIPVGSQSLEITLPTVGDKVSESDETFNLVFSNITNAVFDNGNETFSATGTIIDDDKPIIRIDDVHILEGDQGFHTENIKVTLSMTAANPVKVHYALLDGTAKGGEDFVTSEDDLIIPAGAKEAYISVAIQGDKIPEAAQDFHIQLSNPSNAQFLDLALTTQNTVTIDSDDGDSLPILTVGKNLAVDEGDTVLTSFPIILTLSKPATDTLSIKYQTIGIDAKVGSDFISTSGTLTFLAGDISKAINISVYGDTEVESDEDFTLSITDPQGMRFSNGLPTQDLTLLIRDDDAEPAQTLQGTAKNDILDATKAGGTGDDILDGLKGIDTMIGGDGNDTYYVDNIKDTITEEDQSQSNAGDDDLVHSIATGYILSANVEHLVIDGKAKGNGTGNVLDNKLIGNLAVNILSGLAGDDTLDGGSGNDMLTGGLGNDTFVFSQGIKGNKNIDTVKDFVHGQDKIYLNADIFSKLATAVGFKSDSDPLSLAKADSAYLVSAAKVKAVDASSYLLYDTATGRLSYDEDGSGKLVASSFVTLTGKPALTLEDFWIS